MKINVLIFMITSLALLFYSCGSSDSGTDKANTVTTDTSGITVFEIRRQRLFEQKCAPCHGSEGTAGIGNAANLHTSKLDSIAIINTISKGRNGMPAFGSQLTMAEIKDVAGDVISLRK